MIRRSNLYEIVRLGCSIRPFVFYYICLTCFPRNSFVGNIRVLRKKRKKMSDVSIYGDMRDKIIRAVIIELLKTNRTWTSTETGISRIDKMTRVNYGSIALGRSTISILLVEKEKLAKFLRWSSRTCVRSNGNLRVCAWVRLYVISVEAYWSSSELHWSAHAHKSVRKQDKYHRASTENLSTHPLLFSLNI